MSTNSDTEDFMPESPHSETDVLLPKLVPTRGLNRDTSLAMSTASFGEGYKCKSEREKERKKRSIMEIWVMCESHYQMHRLSNLYFADKHYRKYVYPLSSITMLSGIMAFTNSTSILNDRNKEYLSLAVGFTAVLSSFIQNLGQEAKDDTKAEMHKSATLGMKKIADQLEFEQMQVDQKVIPFRKGYNNHFKRTVAMEQNLILMLMPKLKMLLKKKTVFKHTKKCTSNAWKVVSLKYQ